MPSMRTRLRVLRAEEEWSRAKLAAQVGVTRQTINSIEKGRYHPNLTVGERSKRPPTGIYQHYCAWTITRRHSRIRTDFCLR